MTTVGSSSPIAVGYSFKFSDIKQFLLEHCNFTEIKKYYESYNEDATSRMLPINIGIHYSVLARSSGFDCTKSVGYLESWIKTKQNKQININIRELYVTKGKKCDIVFALMNAGGELFYGAIHNPNKKSTFVLKKQLTTSKDQFFTTIKLEPGTVIEGIPYIYSG